MAYELVQTTAFVEEDTDIRFNRYPEHSYVGFYPNKETKISVLGLFVSPTTAKRLRDFFNSREVVDFIEGRETVEVPAGLVVGQSIACPACDDRFDPDEDLRDAAFGGSEDVLTVLERRYAEHYQEAHRG